MRSIGIFIFYLVSHFLVAQENNLIDEKNGIGPFLLGNNVQKYEKHMVLDYSISLGQKYYIYRGGELKSIADNKIHKINLGFDEDILFYLDIYFRSKDNFEAIKSYLETEFGKSGAALDQETRGLVQAVSWQGENVIAQLVEFSSEAADEDDRNMVVFMLFKRE